MPAWGGLDLVTLQGFLVEETWDLSDTLGIHGSRRKWAGLQRQFYKKFGKQGIRKRGTSKSTAPNTTI